MKVGKNITEFCKSRNISVATYCKRRKQGLAPKEYRDPASKEVIITPEEERAYDKRMESAEIKRLAKLQFELRSAQARLAGQKSAIARAAKRAAKRPRPER